MSTRVGLGDFQGKPLFQIDIYDKTGQLKRFNADRPFVSLGVKKVEAILNHLDEARRFVDKYKDQQPAPQQQYQQPAQQQVQEADVPF